METSFDFVNRIVSQGFSADALYEAYQYFMGGCDWEPSHMKPGIARDFCLCIGFKDAVDDGGIASFFYNYSGDMAAETLSALNKFDPETAKVLADAINCFPGGVVPKNIDERNRLLDEFDDATAERFEKLNDLYLDDDYYKKIFGYIAEHKNEFKQKKPILSRLFKQQN